MLPQQRHAESSDEPGRQRGWRWIRWFAVSGAVSFLALVGLGLAVTCKPAWYRPESVDYSRLDRDEADIANLVDRIGAALNQHRPIDVELRAEQLNRWIAERLEWPEGERVDLGPAEQPYVDFLTGGQIRLAALVKSNGVGVVASLLLKPEIAGDQIVLRAESVHAGLVAAPRGMIVEAVRRQLQSSKAASLMTPEGDIALPNDFEWPNGKVRCRVASLSFADGAARLRLEPRSP